MTDPVTNDHGSTDQTDSDAPDKHTDLNTATGVGMGMGEPNSFEPEEHPDSVPDSTTPGE